MSLVGSLLYLTHSCPNLSFAIGHVARYMQTPHESHWKAGKRILRYIQGTIRFGIHYSIRGEPLFVGFTDSDWAGDPDDRKSIAGYVFSLGSRSITWPCKKQQALSLSSAKAKYRAIVNASQEALWLQRILLEFDSSSSSLLHFGATIKVPSSLPKIQFYISATNTLSYTFTSSEILFMIVLLKFSISLQMIKL